MHELAIERCRLLDAPEVADALGLPKARERHKYGCPVCGSSDGLHAYPGEGRGLTCFAGCGWQGYDAIGIVEATLGLRFKAAVGWLADEFGFGDLVDGDVDRGEAVSRLEAARQRRKERERAREKKRRARKKKAEPLWHRLWYRLELGAEASAYLEERGIRPHIAEHLGVRSVETGEQYEKLFEGFWPDELEVMGLVGRSNGEPYRLMRHTPFLVIPYWYADEGIDVVRFRDLSGQIDAPYRSPVGHRSDIPYLEAAVELEDAYSTLYVCEAELDAISVLQAGFAAMSSCGSGVWEKGWCDGFRWFDRVVVLCDGDDAGRRFSHCVRDACAHQLGMDWCDGRLSRQVFSDGVDANDCLRDGTLKEYLRAG